MAARRLSMRKIKKVLRLNKENGLSARQIAKSCDIALSTAKDYFDRAQKAALTWPLPPELDDTVLEHLPFPSNQPIRTVRRQIFPIDFL